MLYVIGIFISFFLALLIFTKKGRATADLILGAWMTVIGLHITVYYAFITGQIYEYSFLLGINFILPFLHVRSGFASRPHIRRRPRWRRAAREVP